MWEDGTHGIRHDGKFGTTLKASGLDLHFFELPYSQTQVAKCLACSCQPKNLAILCDLLSDLQRLGEKKVTSWITWKYMLIVNHWLCKAEKVRTTVLKNIQIPSMKPTASLHPKMDGKGRLVLLISFLESPVFRS